VSEKIITMNHEPKKSRFTINQKITIFAIIMIGSIIAFPSVYSAVEPHIQITMENSQTQDPFVIKDSFGVEVFSIDPDGVITPSQGGGGGASLNNPEEIIYSELTGMTDSDNVSSDFDMQPFTVPSTSDFWLITAVEMKVDEATGNDAVCIAIMRLGGSTSFASIESDSIGSYYTMGVVGVGDTDMLGFKGTGKAQTRTLTDDTVYKIPIDSLVVNGGEELFVAFASCYGFGSDEIYFVASSTLSETLEDKDSWVQPELGSFSDYLFFDPIEHDIRVNHLSDRIVMQSSDGNGYLPYMQVYAKPLE